MRSKSWSIRAWNEPLLAGGFLNVGKALMGKERLLVLPEEAIRHVAISGSSTPSRIFCNRYAITGSVSV